MKLTELKPGQKLLLKNAFTTTATTTAVLPVWEVGYSSSNDSEKYYDLHPLFSRCSPIKELREQHSLSFYLEIEKVKLLDDFELI